MNGARAFLPIGRQGLFKSGRWLQERLLCSVGLKIGPLFRSVVSALSKGASGKKEESAKCGACQQEKQYFEQGDEEHCAENQRKKELCKSHGT